MRISTSPVADEVAGIAVIHAALDAGASLLDTANVYASDGDAIGHNERLIAAALATWHGDAARIEIATKGGLTRPGGRWQPDGRAVHLRDACEASLHALGVPRIALYQLHAVDPRTSFATSVRALVALQKDGLVDRIGLCNVNVGQIQAARRIAEITTIQVAMSPFDDENLRNGVAEYCRDEGLRLLAYRPLGGADRDRCARDPVVTRIAGDHGVTAHEVALAWLRDLHPCVIPLPGATRVETAASLARVSHIALSDAERERLDAHFPAGRLLRVPRKQRCPAGPDGDVVLVMGLPGAGKSTLARDFVTRGYERLNRDERGGRLADLADALDAGLRRGQRKWVLDNTYASRKSRNEIIECAWLHGAPVRCIRIDTSVADAQINAVQRMLDAHGRLPSPDELRTLGKADHRFFGPDAQFRYDRSLEVPVIDEGFADIETIPFARRDAETSAGRTLVVDADALVTKSVAPASAVVDIRAAHVALLRGFHEREWNVLLTAWRPEISRGRMTDADVREWFDRIRETLAFDMVGTVCSHPAGPPVCWCRKPLPGLVLEFLHARRLPMSAVRIVASSAADRTMAGRLGAECVELDEFLSGASTP
jgi:aryl-alcohol dehydrogenase-like predicted oxidoreductase